MKFGKRYEEALDQPGIAPEWKQTAIEYRKLKKVINRVAKELKDLGLTSEVLKAMMEEGASGEHGGAKVEHVADDATPSSDSPKGTVDAELPKFAWDSSSEESDHYEGAAGPNGDNMKARRRSKSRRRPTATYELGGTSEHPEPRIKLVFESASSDSISDTPQDSDQPTLFQPHSSDTDDSSDAQQHIEDPSRFTEVHSDSEESAAPPQEEEPDSESAEASVGTPAEDAQFEGARPKENYLLKKMYGLEVEDRDADEYWESERGRRRSDETVRYQPGQEDRRDDTAEPAKETKPANAAKVDDEPVPWPSSSSQAQEVSEDADDEGSPSLPTQPSHKHRHRHRRHRKEVLIPLQGDTEFLTLLATALSSLAALQQAQKQQFAQAVQLLAKDVSNVASPSRPKSDLYVWREIFGLWVEASIFESSRERDRGELPVEECEKRLNWFVDQVAQRKLAKKMKHKESRGVLERFIKLNVQLLDLKRFQLANEEAARKILKKHDKRTALTASQGFPDFIAAATSLTTTNNSGAESARKLVLPGLPSLPHILLTTLTSTLLPIIPSLDDYVCGICGDIAFKPIKLDCGHNFCVRCLVKMQKRGQDACPHCRKKVVLRANAANLDHALAEYLVMWFPKEVKRKDTDNRIEAGKEELEAMGIADHKCFVQ